jgi:spore maturation protein CgeB
MKIAFFGSSILSSYWNGAATYYRGLLKALADLGHDVTFYESDAYERQLHRDIEPPRWARVVVYAADDTGELDECLGAASRADVVIKASGVGVFDEYLEKRVPRLRPGQISLFWDVDAPATLDRLAHNAADPLRRQIPRFSAVLTYGGGDRVREKYLQFEARDCQPIYNAVDPDTHHPTAVDPMFSSDVSFLGNRLPDREARVEEFFLAAARQLPDRGFLLGGSGWSDKSLPTNVRNIGHVSTEQHNVFNSSAAFVLNINRESMASWGFSPPTRVFEAVAAGACLITDEWPGIESFLRPGIELLTARSGMDVCSIVQTMSRERAREIGSAARARVLRDHTYALRAKQVTGLLDRLRTKAGCDEAVAV